MSLTFANCVTRSRAIYPSVAIPAKPRLTGARAAADLAMGTEWAQKTVTLKSKPRGCHVITKELYQQIPELYEFDIGMANIWHVPLDLADSLDRLVPEGTKLKYRHDDEGPDDMPAHVKSSLMGPSLTIPISKGKLALGTWQGVYLNEHRDYGGSRRVTITIQGQKRSDGRSYGSYQ